MKRHALSDAQWERIHDLFPENGKRGQQWKDHRLMVDGILWAVKTGAQWRDVPERFGPWKTVYERFCRWTQEGLWDQILKRLQSEADAVDEIDWKLFCIDGSSIRAHRSAAGAKKNLTLEGEPADHALGRSRGGFGTKIHLVCEGKGKPLAVQISGGQEHESKYFKEMMGKIGIPQGRGRPRKNPDNIAGDKAYSSGENRSYVKARGIGDVIPTKTNEERREGFDKELYRDRNIVERCIGWLKESRRIATRFENLALHYLGVIKLGMILEYL